MTKSQLIEKVYRCIDEAYPNTDEASPDVEEFNIPALLEEAIRWVAKVVPIHALGSGTKLEGLKVPDNFLRIISFKGEDWKVPVTEILSQQDPKYWQQRNPALRGTNSRPIVFFVVKDGELQFEPHPSGEEFILEESYYFGLPNMDDEFVYPDKLIDITAWKTAELIFSVMQDANGVSIAQAQVASILPTL